MKRKLDMCKNLMFSYRMQLAEMQCNDITFQFVKCVHSKSHNLSEL